MTRHLWQDTASSCPGRDNTSSRHGQPERWIMHHFCFLFLSLTKKNTDMSSSGCRSDHQVHIWANLIHIHEVTHTHTHACNYLNDWWLQAEMWEKLFSDSLFCKSSPSLFNSGQNHELQRNPTIPQKEETGFCIPWTHRILNIYCMDYKRVINVFTIKSCQSMWFATGKRWPSGRHRRQVRGIL